MSSGNLQARRATVDDLAVLRQLWHEAGLTTADRERHLTEFQLVETGNGEVLGAIGLRISGLEGLLHSETLRETGDDDELRRRLWNRVQAVCRNHGLYRIWTAEIAKFWADLGFADADETILNKLPESFQEMGKLWRVLKLRAESIGGVSVEQELEIFALSQRESSDRLVRQVTYIKNGAYVVLFIALVLGAIVIGLAVLPKSFWAGRLKSQPPQDRPVAPATNAVTQPAR